MSGVPELLVLRLLARQEMYGYEIVRAVKLVTAEAISLGEGVIYPVLHGPEKAGALKAKRKPVFQGNADTIGHDLPAVFFRLP